MQAVIKINMAFKHNCITHRARKPGRLRRPQQVDKDKSGLVYLIVKTEYITEEDTTVHPTASATGYVEQSPVCLRQFNIYSV